MQVPVAVDRTVTVFNEVSLSYTRDPTYLHDEVDAMISKYRESSYLIDLPVRFLLLSYLN